MDHLPASGLTRGDDVIATARRGFGDASVVSVLGVGGIVEAGDDDGRVTALWGQLARRRLTDEHAIALEIDGVAWEALLEDAGDRRTLLVARSGAPFSVSERALGASLGETLRTIAAFTGSEQDLRHRQGLDALVSRVAARLMTAGSGDRAAALNEVVADLGQHLGSDVAFMRRHDHARGLSILEAEWPVRDVPEGTVDPMAEIPFDHDESFTRTQHLRETMFSGWNEADEAYFERIEEAGGPRVGGVAVPLIMHDDTWGVLAFLHFSVHEWTREEVQALEAVASLVVHFQARLDAEARLYHHSTHDDLTGLANRRALVEELDARTREGRSTALLVIDLDRFKVMNDFLGHTNGDRLLAEIGQRLARSVRAGDYAARLGGDEFVVLLDVDGVEAAEEGARRLLSELTRPVRVGDRTVNPMASVGVALGEGPDAESLLAMADVAMYQAKARGHNLIVTFDDDIRERVIARHRTELSLAEAIAGGALRLHYQPELDLVTGEILAVEALVRWQHPTEGLLAAGAFIEAAEESGLIVDIGRWVLAEGCQQMGEWIRRWPDREFTLRVNLSPADLRDAGIVDYVTRCLDGAGVPARRLCVEVTEHAMIGSGDEVATSLARLRALGIEVAIDDFGTGYASMTELKRLTADFLKLDMTFVRGVTTNRVDRTIVESIIRLGHTLGLAVIAEGIEDEATRDELVGLGCRRGQGYLLSRPLTPEAIESFLGEAAVGA